MTGGSKSGPDHTGTGTSSNAPQAPRPPRKTPMYQAQNAERYARQAQIKEMQAKANGCLLCYVAGSGALIVRDDVIGFVELLHNVPRPKNVDLLLHTGGGDINAAEKIVSMLRAAVGTAGRFRVIVPDFAKSAGTLIALAADKILMSDSSELGPIDPQFPKKDSDGTVRWYSVLNYLEAYDTVSKKIQENPADAAANIMLTKFDPTTLVQFEAVKRRARMLAEQHLNRWMFQQKKATYTKIAGDLMDIARWPAHGQMIGYEDAREMGLEIEYLAPDTADWQDYWSLYCQQRLAVKDGQRFFASDYASLAM
jgi:Serine dehydrogenase proteinase